MRGAVLWVGADVSGGGGQFRSASGTVGETRCRRLPGRFHVLTRLAHEAECWVKDAGETNTMSNLTSTLSAYRTTLWAGCRKRKTRAEGKDEPSGSGMHSFHLMGVVKRLEQAYIITCACHCPDRRSSNLNFPPALCFLSSSSHKLTLCFSETLSTCAG